MSEVAVNSRCSDARFVSANRLHGHLSEGQLIIGGIPPPAVSSARQLKVSWSSPPNIAVAFDSQLIINNPLRQPEAAVPIDIILHDMDP